MKMVRQGFVLLLVMLLVATSMTPMVNDKTSEHRITIPNSTVMLSATDLQVTNETFNHAQEFNDDDFVFTVRNGSLPIAQANVTILFASNSSQYDSLETFGDGTAVFYNIPQGSYIWNVTWSLAPDIFENGTLQSDGPEAVVSVEIENLDEENDDDDLNATILDIDGDPAEGLNFTIYSRDSSSIWAQTLIDENGEVSFTDIPIGNYTWMVTVQSGQHAGVVLEEANFTTDATQFYLHQTIGPFTGDPDFYDLEVFTYYETTLDPLVGAVVNVTYYNGSVIDVQTTPENGTVQFIDLPVEFINWSVTFGGLPVEDGDYSFNLTALSADIRDPVITSPGDQEFLFETFNITITWQLQDEYPEEIKVYVDDFLNTTVTWANKTYDYIFNVTGMAIGEYDVRIEAHDQNGNVAEDTINLRIYEDVSPEVDGPEDVEYTFTDTGNSLEWNVSDDYLNKFSITRDGELVIDGDVDPEDPFISIGVDGLNIGVYIYLFMVNDTSGNNATDEVTVTVLRDSVSPVFTYIPPTIIYNRGILEVVRNWTVQDDYMSTYKIEVDGFVIEEGVWDSETISFNFGGLSEGTHWVTLTVTDLGGNTASSSVLVEVLIPEQVLWIAFIGSLGIGVIAIFIIYRYLKNR